MANGQSAWPCMERVMSYKGLSFFKVTSDFDKGRAADVVYIDFHKAFDKACHG